MQQADLLRRGAAEFVGTFTLIFVGAGSIIATQGTNLTAIGLAHGLLCTGAGTSAGPPETGLEEPRPGDAGSI